MKATIAALLALSSTVLAQTYTESKPFTLTLKSSNKTLNGMAIYSCHEGAAIEGLCVGNAPGQTYNLNITDGQTASSIGKTGILVYEFIGGNANESEPMQFLVNPATNVAHAQFAPVAPYNAATVGFDKNNKMFVPSYYDDTVVPPKMGTEIALYHWYICNYDYEAYDYSTLNFVYGVAKPQNPTCQKVDVVKTAIKTTGYGYKA